MTKSCDLFAPMNSKRSLSTFWGDSMLALRLSSAIVLVPPRRYLCQPLKERCANITQSSPLARRVARRHFSLTNPAICATRICKNALTDLPSSARNFNAKLEEAREQLALAKELAKGQQDAEDLLRRAVRIFEKANVDQQNEIAKATCLELGGFTVDAAKKLQVGKP